MPLTAIVSVPEPVNFAPLLFSMVMLPLLSDTVSESEPGLAAAQGSAIDTPLMATLPFAATV